MRLYGSIPEFWPGLAEDPDFNIEARKVAYGMAQEVAKANGHTWREIARKSSRARQIFESLRSELKASHLDFELEQIAARNARLIRSLPLEIAEKLNRHAMALQMSGARSETLGREIHKIAKHLTKSKVELIARTEVSRAETELTRARAERIGIEWYQWQTAEDSRVRESHRHMDQVLVQWNDAPAPEQLVHIRSTLGHYNAGAAPNCRCVALPVADLNEIHWPAKVYRAGKITRMSRAQFTRVVGIPMAA